MMILRTCNGVYAILMKLWLTWFFGNVATNRPYRQYFLSDDYEFDESFDTVPEDAVYVEEWVKEGEKKCVVRYEGEASPQVWIESPFDQPTPPCPWVWVGDRDTEIDLTRTFNKFLVVGNVITLDLVLKLIQVTDRTNLIYIESGTFKELKFPGDGITIVEYDDHRSDHRAV
jgi:hypothetical protein